tara:strand:- start:1497 stop:1943 length:447 start_codon:yes stop_codon:yes gene_type:complete
MKSPGKDDKLSTGIAVAFATEPVFRDTVMIALQSLGMDAVIAAIAGSPTVIEPGRPLRHLDEETGGKNIFESARREVGCELIERARVLEGVIDADIVPDDVARKLERLYVLMDEEGRISGDSTPNIVASLLTGQVIVGKVIVAVMGED